MWHQILQPPIKPLLKYATGQGRAEISFLQKVGPARVRATICWSQQRWCGYLRRLASTQVPPGMSNWEEAPGRKQCTYFEEPLSITVRRWCGVFCNLGWATEKK